MTTNKYILISFMLMSANMLLACGDAFHNDGQQQTLQQNRELWRQQNLDSYRYHFRRSCFCGSDFRAPVMISVNQGAISNVIDAIDGVPVNTQNMQYKTIKIFLPK